MFSQRKTSKQKNTHTHTHTLKGSEDLLKLLEEEKNKEKKENEMIETMKKETIVEFDYSNKIKKGDKTRPLSNDEYRKRLLRKQKLRYLI